MKGYHWRRKLAFSLAMALTFTSVYVPDAVSAAEVIIVEDAADAVAGIDEENDAALQTLEASVEEEVLLEEEILLDESSEITGTLETTDSGSDTLDPGPDEGESVDGSSEEEPVQEMMEETESFIAEIEYLPAETLLASEDTLLSAEETSGTLLTSWSWSGASLQWNEENQI